MHVCNVKKFMVYGGLSDENMIELLERFACCLLQDGTSGLFNFTVLPVSRTGLICFVFLQSQSTVVRVVQKSIGNGTFRGAAAEKPLNRLTQNLAWVITSGRPLSTPNGILIGSGAWPPRRGEMLMVCALFVCSSAQLGVKPLDRFWRVMSQNACFWKYCITLGVRTTISQFQGVKIPKNR